MTKIKVKVKGTAPLLLHKYVGETKTKAKQKVYIPEEEAEKVTYRNKKGKIYIPSTHFKGAMIKAGVDFKYEGRKTYKEYIKAGITFQETEIILTPQEYEIHSCPVVIGRSRIVRSRPMFTDWSCEFIFEIIDDELARNPGIIKEILEKAGKYKGVGDYRPEFGRFEVVEFKKL